MQEIVEELAAELGFDGAMDTSITIRTFCLKGRTVTFQAGGGITLLSEPGPEYEETLTKAARVFQAFEPEAFEPDAGGGRAP